MRLLRVVLKIVVQIAMILISNRPKMLLFNRNLLNRPSWMQIQMISAHRWFMTIIKFRAVAYLKGSTTKVLCCNCTLIGTQKRTILALNKINTSRMNIPINNRHEILWAKNKQMASVLSKQQWKIIWSQAVLSVTLVVMMVQLIKRVPSWTDSRNKKIMFTTRIHLVWNQSH